jgi:hypothetical protein
MGFLRGHTTTQLHLTRQSSIHRDHGRAEVALGTRLSKEIPTQSTFSNAAGQ